MTDYITEAGTIYWDRAEPFIKMLGEHEHESFSERVKYMRTRGGGNNYNNRDAASQRPVSQNNDNGVKIEVGRNGQIDRKREVQKRITMRITEKKRVKIENLK